MVLRVAIDDEKSKRKAMTVVAAVQGKHQSSILHCNFLLQCIGFRELIRYLIAGVESVAVDLKERKITVIGDADHHRQ